MVEYIEETNIQIWTRMRRQALCQKYYVVIPWTECENQEDEKNFNVYERKTRKEELQTN